MLSKCNFKNIINNIFIIKKIILKKCLTMHGGRYIILIACAMMCEVADTPTRVVMGRVVR